MGAPQVKVKVQRTTVLGVAQLVGLLCMVAAVTLLAGPAWGLLLTGALLVTAGVLAEAGWL